MLKSRSNIPPDTKKFETAAPTNEAEQRSWTKGHNTKNKIGAMDPETKPGDPTQNQHDNRHIDTAGTTAEGRETALPYCKYANKDKTQKRAPTQTYIYRRRCCQTKGDGSLPGTSHAYHTSKRTILITTKRGHTNTYNTYPPTHTHNTSHKHPTAKRSPHPPHDSPKHSP